MPGHSASWLRAVGQAEEHTAGVSNLQVASYRRALQSQGQQQRYLRQAERRVHTQAIAERHVQRVAQASRRTERIARDILIARRRLVDELIAMRNSMPQNVALHFDEVEHYALEKEVEVVQNKRLAALGVLHTEQQVRYVVGTRPGWHKQVDAATAGAEVSRADCNKAAAALLAASAQAEQRTPLPLRPALPPALGFSFQPRPRSPAPPAPRTPLPSSAAGLEASSLCRRVMTRIATEIDDVALPSVATRQLPKCNSKRGVAQDDSPSHSRRNKSTTTAKHSRKVPSFPASKDSAETVAALCQSLIAAAVSNVLLTGAQNQG